MAVWVAGKAFRCKGMALDETYDGPLMRPSDMKRAVQSFYSSKREASETKGQTGTPLLYEHNENMEIGDVHHQFIDKDMNFWNVMRLSPTRPEAKRIIAQLKSGDKSARVGLSFDTQTSSYSSGEREIYFRRKPIALSIVAEPAHHDDDTYVSLVGETEKDVLAQLFAAIYGPDTDERAQRPYFIPKILKAEVRQIYPVDARTTTAAATDDAMDIVVDEPSNKTPAEPASNEGTPEVPSDAKTAPDEADEALFTQPNEKSEETPGTASSLSSVSPSLPEKTAVKTMASTEHAEDDAMDIVPPATPEPTKGVKRTLEEPANQADETGNDEDAGVEENEDVTTTTTTNKKPRLDDGSAKKTNTTNGYTITQRDADIQMKSLNNTIQELLRLKNLANAPQDVQKKFIDTLFEEQKAKALEAKQSAEVVLRELLGNAGLDETQISAIEKATEDPKVGSVVRTMVAVARSQGMNQKLMEVQHQNSRQSFVPKKTIFENDNRQRGTSIFEQAPLESAKPSNDMMDLDFSATIFNALNTGGALNRTPTPRTRAMSQQEPPMRSNPRLGERQAPAPPTEEELAAKKGDQERKEYLERIAKLQPNRVVRRTKYDVNNPLFTIKTPEGENGLDTMDLQENVFENIRPGSFSHHFLDAIIRPDLEALEKRAYVDYGYDEINNNYYTNQKTLLHAPRRIANSGVITLGNDSF